MIFISSESLFNIIGHGQDEASAENTRMAVSSLVIIVQLASQLYHHPG